jgi:hypothetical protein
MAAAPGAAVRGEFKPEHKAVVQDDGAIPRAGIPEIPEEPALLRDGRRLWRFEADAIPEQASGSTVECRQAGAGFSASGGRYRIIP